jgi:hypothetical protein
LQKEGHLAALDSQIESLEAEIAEYMGRGTDDKPTA